MCHIRSIVINKDVDLTCCLFSSCLFFFHCIRLNGAHTSDLTRAYACKSKACFETAAVAITVLTQRVASERCRCTLAILTRITTCALVAIIACHALAICPRARASAGFAPLIETDRIIGDMSLMLM